MVLQSSTNAVETARYFVRDYQKWTITPAGGGFYKIINVANGNVLENGLGLVGYGEAVDVVPFTGADVQLWKIDQLADGSYRIVPQGGINKLALTTTIKIKPGNGIALQSFTGDDTQRWVITEP